LEGVELSSMSAMPGTPEVLGRSGPWQVEATLPIIAEVIP
jgi:hypothetical protein